MSGRRSSRRRGPTLVLVPGIQGRWEWMRPAVDALARHFRVVTFSLLGERARGRGPAGVRRVPRAGRCRARVRGCERAIVCGVSYGGLIAVQIRGRASRTASSASCSSPRRRRRGSRTRACDATPTPRDARRSRSWPAPPAGSAREIAAAHSRTPRSAGGRPPATSASILAHPGSPRRMAARVRRLAGCDFVADARRVRAPTLVVTGEPELDRVVPVAGTREYLRADSRAGRCYARTDGTHRPGHAPAGVRGDRVAMRPRRRAGRWTPPLTRGR